MAMLPQVDGKHVGVVGNPATQRERWANQSNLHGCGTLFLS
jgi:hypothetical protein